MNLSWIDRELEELKELGVDRKLLSFPSKEFLNFCSNDYLGFSHHPQIITAVKNALDQYGVGSCSSRLLSGNTAIHEKVEAQLRSFFNSEDALLYAAGYLANFGVISSLVSRNDFVISDKLIHASLIDGIRISLAKHFRFRHNDLNHLEDILKKTQNKNKNSKTLIVVESVYSMEGDGPELKELLSLAKHYGALLLVDEAHAFGVFGKAGRGRLSMFDYDQSSVIITSTFSKAIGAYGGFVICGKNLKKLLLSKSRPFIFNTSLVPAILAGASIGLDLLLQKPDLGKELLCIAHDLRDKLKELGIDTLGSFSQIIPIAIRDNKQAKVLAKDLHQKKIFIPAIVSPSVNCGEERLRISLTLDHSVENIERLIKNLTRP